MKIICFGDSNTYGYDPRAYFGGRYGEDSRWVDVLAKNSGHQTVNYGQNGRAIPAYEDELALYKSIFLKENADMIAIMLGSNDILMGLTVKAICVRMERLINHLPFEKNRILLIAPPYLRSGAWVESEAQIEASRVLSQQYEALAARLGLRFAAAEGFGVEIGHDGVHFSAKGHRAFAKGIQNVIENMEDK